MRRPNRLTAKLFFEGAESVDIGAFVPVFHRWIQRRSVGKLLVDVHNYSHVHHGPGILLVGHEGDFAIDSGGGRIGLLYRHKRGDEQSFSDVVVTAVRSVARGAVLLLEERTLKDRLGFDSSTIVVEVADRLAYPNNDDTYNALKADFQHSIASITGAEQLAVERIDNDTREPLAIRVAVEGGFSLPLLAAEAEAAGTV